MCFDRTCERFGPRRYRRHDPVGAHRHRSRGHRRAEPRPGRRSAGRTSAGGGPGRVDRRGPRGRTGLHRAPGTGRAAGRRHRAVRRRQRDRRLHRARARPDDARCCASTPIERLAVVQAGVVNDDLRAAVAEHGLWYPPDPASSPWSTIGGNVATNAGGICCVKYGVTRDYVLGLEMVTGTGELVRLGRHDRQGRRRLRPDRAGRRRGGHARHRHRGHASGCARCRRRRAPSSATSPRSVDAGDAVRAVAAAGLTPSALELIDRHCLAAVDKWKNMGLSVDADVILLARVDDPGDERRRAWPRRWSSASPRPARPGPRSRPTRSRPSDVRRAPAGLPGPRTPRPGGHRGRVRAEGAGAGDAARASRRRRAAARHHHRQHRARRRRQPASAADRARPATRTSGGAPRRRSTTSSTTPSPSAAR